MLKSAPKEIGMSVKQVKIANFNFEYQEEFERVHYCH